MVTRVWNFKYSFSHVLLSWTEALTKYTNRGFLLAHLSYNRSNWRTRFSISLHSMCTISEISQKRSRIICVVFFPSLYVVWMWMKKWLGFRCLLLLKKKAANNSKTKAISIPFRFTVIHNTFYVFYAYMSISIQLSCTLLLVHI